MKDFTLSLVDAIILGKATAIEDSFQAAISDKISYAMEARKIELAQGLFKESVEEELTLEDYSIEEIEDFMMSEEFEQLDEVSKKTLGSYVKKAADSVQANTRQANTGDDYDLRHKSLLKTNKRISGIGSAVRKLTKEEVEELDEVLQTSSGINSYLNKSREKRANLVTKNTVDKSPDENAEIQRKLKKSFAGSNKAIDKKSVDQLHKLKEESEELDD